MAVDWTKVRERLRQLVTNAEGDCTPSTVWRATRDVDVRYETVARFLHLYDGADQQSHSMRYSTVEKLAVALDTQTDYLLYGLGTVQRSFWPLVHQTEAQLNDLDPVEELRKAVLGLDTLPRELRLKLCRAALSAILDAAVIQGQPLPVRLHETLLSLDAGLDTLRRAS